jgi:uncharacterized membrane protein YbhN (UPF0104 family)
LGIRGAVRAGLAVAGVAAVVFLLTQAVHNVDLLGRLRHATFGWFGLCVAGELVTCAGLVASYRGFAASSDGPRLPVGLTIRVVALSFGAFAATTAIGGLWIEFWTLREAGEPTALASARMIGLETLQWATLAVATSVAGALSLAGAGRPVGLVAPICWIVVTGGAIAVGAWISAPGRRAEARLRPRVLALALATAVGGLRLIRRLLHQEPELRALAIGGAAAYWGGGLVCAWGALQAFHAPVGAVALLLGYATASAALILPLPFGGAGSLEAALTGGFVLAGAPVGSALLAAIAFRVFSFWLPVLGALGSAATARSLRERLHEIARARAAAAMAD